MSNGKISRTRQRRVPYEPISVRQQRLAQGRCLPPCLLTRPRRGPTSLLRLLVSFIIAMFAITGGLFGLAVAGAAGTYYYFTHDLPSVEELKTNAFQTTKIYDRNWVLLHEVADQKTGWRTQISLEEMSPWVIKGTIATEDATFYDNPGVDVRSIVRAVYINLSGIGSSGGSTITMQVVRNVLPLEGAFEFNYGRKVKEAILALEFGRRYSKDEILQMYLNEVYYGSRAYGIEAAAQVYFGKLAKDLDLAESSMLVGLPQSPSLYDPTRSFSAAKARQRVVLDQMVKEEDITEEQAEAAYQVDLQARLRPTENRVPKAPHFVNYVLSVLEQRYGSEAVTRGGLVVHTTLDYETQVAAEEVVYAHIQTIKHRNATNGALVAVQPWSGQVIAMVGSADYNDQSIDGQVNVATRERQPGSAFKPISYAAAMMKGWSPTTIIVDSLVKYPNKFGARPCDNVTKTTDECYVPENFDFKYSGPVPVREALGRSLNIPAVKAIKYAGVAYTINLAHAMGIKTGLWRGLDFYGLAITLGGGEVQPLEMAAAYATFANNGVHVPTTPFLKVTDGRGRVLEEFNKDKLGGRQVLTPEVAYMMTDVLKDDAARVRTFGANSILNFRPRPAAVKTGSTTDNRDGWTVGYTTDLAVAVWVGNSDNSPTRQVDGVAAAGPIWNKFLMRVYTDPELLGHYAEFNTMAGPDGLPLPKDWTRPAGIVVADVCTVGGKIALRGQAAVRGMFARGSVPVNRCGEVTPDEMAELQDAMQTLRRLPDRFFPDGRTKLQQLFGMARVVAAPRPTPASPAEPWSMPAALDLPTPTPTLAPTAVPVPPTATPAPARAPAQPAAPSGGGANPVRAVAPTPTPPPPPQVVAPRREVPPTPTPPPPRVVTTLVAVPNVVGLPEEEAQRRLRAAGLATAPPVYQRQRDLPAGVRIDAVPVGAVLSTSPAAGAQVERGTVITIAVRARE